MLPAELLPNPVIAAAGRRNERNGRLGRVVIFTVIPAFAGIQPRNLHYYYNGACKHRFRLFAGMTVVEVSK